MYSLMLVNSYPSGQRQTFSLTFLSCKIGTVGWASLGHWEDEMAHRQSPAQGREAVNQHQ